MSVFRCYTEKKSGFNVEATGLTAEAREFLGITGLESVRMFARYDIEGVSAEQFAAAIPTVLSEPLIDDAHTDALPPIEGDAFRLAVEALPGQYDQRADSCAQCIQMLNGGEKPTVKTAKAYVFFGELTDADKDALRGHLINPVEAREATAAKPETLVEVIAAPEKVATIDGFQTADAAALGTVLETHSLAMDIDDLRFMQVYFRDTEHRDPTVTELKLIDTYWSDHCRHTTFMTRLENIKIEDDAVAQAFERYLALRDEVYGADTMRPITLMDIATIGAKALKKRGALPNIDISEEINACSIHIDVEVDGKTEDWLLMFKNETHNHPTEIEPFGGAATCIGGCIRDPLSGRAFVYQAMRVTGAADPRAAIEDTIAGKLPQRRLTTTAARGYSAYGNQIGLATGLVQEFYHPSYAAKRMEIGAVVGAVKASNVRRETPEAGDVVILLGGRTGRDGIGGATGSSKTHNQASLTNMASEVQKGNAPEERKIQRLFRDAEVAKMIRRCNDFGAGGVSVAIGELADGLDIDLSKVRKKYDGLGATELAISESQERMAVVVEAADAERFIAKAAGENLEAYIVAEVTESPRMVLRHDGEVVADLSREFLNSNGAEKRIEVTVAAPQEPREVPENYRELNDAAQFGLREMFDSSVGAGTVLAPFGGKTQKTMPQVMAATIPVQSGETTTASVMSYGFNPYISEANPYFGARFAVTTSIAKLVAAGADPDAAYLSFQEYFEKLKKEPTRWGKPFAALLGALDAQMEFGAAAIGGKDSMSGSFTAPDGAEINVPPTLVSFAIAPADARTVISPEFKAAGHEVAYFAPEGDTLAIWKRVHEYIKDGTIIAARAVEGGNVMDEVAGMCFGNEIGFEENIGHGDLKLQLGGIIAEVVVTPMDGTAVLLGWTREQKQIYSDNMEPIALADLLANREATLESVFPTKVAQNGEVTTFTHAPSVRPTFKAATSIARPRALVLSFPGTNSEIDSANALTRAGALAETVVIRNLTSAQLADSVAEVAAAIRRSQIVVLPGGFSGGDEPDGSAKFITAFFRNAAITDATHELIKTRDGLMLGICNGFQALIKLGLVPYGEIVAPESNAFTIAHNKIGRHQAKYVYTRIASVNSPWMINSEVGDVHAIPISHGEGRFYTTQSELDRLAASGQIATQYCDLGGAPTMDIAFNPNGALHAIEGIFSPDGRIFGKMGHSERRGEYVAKNICGDKHQPIFESGVTYYK